MEQIPIGPVFRRNEPSDTDMKQLVERFLSPCLSSSRAIFEIEASSKDYFTSSSQPSEIAKESGLSPLASRPSRLVLDHIRTSA